MKYSNTALKELSARYGKILRKCALLNAAILLTASLSIPANAAEIMEGQKFIGGINSDSDNQNAAGLTITYGDALNNNGVNKVEFANNQSVNSGAAMKALNGFIAGDGWTFDNNHSDKASGGLYIKIPNSGTENRNVSFGNNTTFSNNSSKWLGGALGIEAADTVTLGDNAVFDTNHSDKDGGAIAVWTDSTNTNVTSGTTLNLGKTEFKNNTATNRGGALANLNNDIIATSYFNTVNIGSGSSFTNNSAIQGGAIYNKGTMNIADTTFSGNKATGSGYGGAIFNGQGILTVNNSTFSGNNATWDGGAISSSTSYLKDSSGKALSLADTRAYWQKVNGFDAANKLVINNSTFDSNTVDSFSGGALGIYSDATITGSEFTNNNAGGNDPSTTVDGGGAIYVGGWGRVDIDGSTFTGNSSNIGGAIATTHAGLAGDEYVTVQNSTFTGNTATEKGGAIANGFSTFNIENSTFKDNSSNGTGGAIQNLANRTINLSGTNTFSGNTAGGVKNDIHNDGTLNVSGLLALDGGITGTGTVNFLDGSSLKAALNSETAIITAGTITGQTALVLETGSEGGTIKLEGTQDSFSFASNSLYDITNESGTYTFAKKDSAAIAESTGATGVVADTIAAVTSGTSSHDEFNAVAENINTMLQSSDAAVVAAGVQAAKALAPVEAPVIQAQTTQTVSQILAAAGSRLSGGSTVSMGESSGDFALGKGSVWAKGLYNKSKYSGTDGFDAYSRGIALGAEAQITDSVKVGLGYAYTNSDIKPDLRKTDIDSNSALLYGEYKPNNWYVNGIASYTWGRYDEHRYATTDVSGKYDVNTIALQAMTGYDIHMDALTFTPEAGLRYMNIDQKAYTDSIGSHIAGNSSDIFTGVLGAKAVYDWNITDNILLKPEVRAAITYDFVRDNATAVMSLANGSVIATDSKALKRFGTEFAVGLTTDIADNLEMGIFWEGKFRNDYTDNTGMINVKYNF